MFGGFETTGCCGCGSVGNKVWPQALGKARQHLPRCGGNDRDLTPQTHVTRPGFEADFTAIPGPMLLEPFQPDFGCAQSAWFWTVENNP